MESEKQAENHPEATSVVQERLNWQVAERDDTKVAQALYAGETIDEVHDLSDAGLLDEFFVFLKDQWCAGDMAKRPKSKWLRTELVGIEALTSRKLIACFSIHKKPHAIKGEAL